MKHHSTRSRWCAAAVGAGQAPAVTCIAAKLMSPYLPGQRDGEGLGIKIQAVSVVIVNYNAGNLLAQCVNAALAQAQQVIVVDNASSDESMDSVSSQFPADEQLVLHHAGHNVGFAAGCNLGLNLASNSLVLFLNPDCVLEPGSLDRMVQVLEGDPSAGMVGGLLTNMDGSEQRGARRVIPTPWRAFVRAFGLARFSNRWPRLFFDFYLHEQPLPSSPIEVEAISGALMLVRRAAIDDVGRWDEKYFLHCEDLDWCMRFRMKHWKILFVPDAPVLHYLGQSSRSRPIFVEWHKHRGMLRFYGKFFRHQYPGVLMLLVRLGVWFRFGMVATKKSAHLLLRYLRGERG